MFRALLLLVVAFFLNGCAQGASGGLVVSKTAKPLGGNLFFETVGDSGFLVLDGEITSETSAVFELIVENVDVPGLVIAQSPGGEVFASHQIGRTVKARRMDTRVVLSCASACVDVFIAGNRREMTDISELGLHSPTVRSWADWIPFLVWFSAFDKTSALEATYVIDQRYWREMGFPEVNEKAYRVPNNRIWIVEPQRALELNLATTIVASEVQ